MKIRNGFVSNSSSSSFIVANTISILSRSMLKTVLDDFGYDKRRKYKTYEKWNKNLRNALRRKDVKEGRLGITMPSCNFDTYIIYKEGNCYISTCNNYQWGPEVMEGMYIGEADKTVDNIVEKNNFLNVRNNLIHSCYHYDENSKLKCPKCKYYFGEYVIDKKGNKICGNCFKGTLEKAGDFKKNKSNKFKSAISYLEIDSYNSSENKKDKKMSRRKKEVQNLMKTLKEADKKALKGKERYKDD